MFELQDFQNFNFRKYCNSKKIRLLFLLYTFRNVFYILSCFTYNLKKHSFSPSFFANS